MFNKKKPKQMKDSNKKNPNRYHPLLHDALFRPIRQCLAVFYPFTSRPAAVAARYQLYDLRAAFKTHPEELPDDIDLKIILEYKMSILDITEALKAFPDQKFPEGTTHVMCIQHATAPINETHKQALAGLAAGVKMQNRNPDDVASEILAERAQKELKITADSTQTDNPLAGLFDESGHLTLKPKKGDSK